MWRSGDNNRRLVLSFYQAGSGRLNASSQAAQQVPFPTEPSHKALHRVSSKDQRRITLPCDGFASCPHFPSELRVTQPIHWFITLSSILMVARFWGQSTILPLLLKHVRHCFMNFVAMWVCICGLLAAQYGYQLLCTVTFKAPISSSPSHTDYLWTLVCIHVQISVWSDLGHVRFPLPQEQSHELIWPQAQIALKHPSSSLPLYNFAFTSWVCAARGHEYWEGGYLADW